MADEVRNLVDRDGIKLVDAVKKHGIDLDRATKRAKELKHAAAYLELHIEQGPVLESLNLPMGVVLGTFGVERHGITFTGQAAHSGSTPMAASPGCAGRGFETASGGSRDRSQARRSLHRRQSHHRARHRHRGRWQSAR